MHDNSQCRRFHCVELFSIGDRGDRSNVVAWERGEKNIYANLDIVKLMFRQLKTETMTFRKTFDFALQINFFSSDQELSSSVSCSEFHSARSSDQISENFLYISIKLFRQFVIHKIRQQRENLNLKSESQLHPATSTSSSWGL